MAAIKRASDPLGLSVSAGRRARDAPPDPQLRQRADAISVAVPWLTSPVQRRIRTFLITDVRGYTRFTEDHGDEAGARLARRFAEVVSEVVAGRDGRVVELRGDEALCVFESPRGALRAAVDLQRRCAAELRADPTLPLWVGVGIDAGEAVPVADGYRGGALNLAARRRLLAGPGEVLVSDGIVHLARRVDDTSYVDRGRNRVKGLADPVRVFKARFPLDLPEIPRASYCAGHELGSAWWRSRVCWRSFWWWWRWRLRVEAGGRRRWRFTKGLLGRDQCQGAAGDEGRAAGSPAWRRCQTGGWLSVGCG